MNHALSIETKAAERYLLGELLPMERDAFEQHFFECAKCASDVCAGSALAHGAHAFFSEVPVETPRPIRQTTARAWRSWFAFPAGIPAAAAFALLTFTAYQNAMLLPGLHRMAAESARPRVLRSDVLVPASRSALPSVLVPFRTFLSALTRTSSHKESGKIRLRTAR
jgi:anti-sigma factor RsiW